MKPADAYAGDIGRFPARQSGNQLLPPFGREMARRAMNLLPLEIPLGKGQSHPRSGRSKHRVSFSKVSTRRRRYRIEMTVMHAPS